MKKQRNVTVHVIIDLHVHHGQEVVSSPTSQESKDLRFENGDWRIFRTEQSSFRTRSYRWEDGTEFL